MNSLVITLLFIATITSLFGLVLTIKQSIWYFEDNNIVFKDIWTNLRQTEIGHKARTSFLCSCVAIAVTMLLLIACVKHIVEFQKLLNIGV